MSNLESKKVLIVGSSSGIGAATATAFAGLGAEVTIASRNQTKLDAGSAGMRAPPCWTRPTKLLLKPFLPRRDSSTTL
jgi:NAD(P)-dependent dehydrogenase (short-subunit alcohol dehydrogenase family)